ncbi:MAG: type II toxin-antitoxin system mRNA interferase toxin, RelE/StbE family [Candidatus Aenigmarchaeota archaeon]|nr:type II toxin-antitoxin system mRNA interferase toxin, RelE/StbE family [Candidatus Aenigmarchaeota archaeon]
MKEKLNRLKNNPRKEIGAHPLHGRLKGKWACWLGSDIRMVYSIHDEKKQIVIEAVGSHKAYQ